MCVFGPCVRGDVVEEPNINKIQLIHMFFYGLGAAWARCVCACVSAVYFAVCFISFVHLPPAPKWPSKIRKLEKKQHRNRPSFYYVPVCCCFVVAGFSFINCVNSFMIPTQHKEVNKTNTHFASSQTQYLFWMIYLHAFDGFISAIISNIVINNIWTASIPLSPRSYLSFAFVWL